MRHRMLFVFAAAAAACSHPAGTASPVSPASPSAAPSTGGDADLVARARAIHSRVITIDTHKDIPDNFATAAADPKTMPSQVNLDKMKAGGYDMAFFAVYVGQGARTDSGDAVAKQRAMTKFTAIHRMAEQMYPNLIEIAYTPEDVIRIHNSGKLIAGIGIENGWVIGHDLSLIKTYYDLGARYMTLAHTSNNNICDSSTDPKGPEWHGLSPFGKQVVAEMNRVGMMVDVSHVSKECMMQATALSTSPVIGSHSSTTAIANVPRNMDDEMLAAIKRNNGVMQTVAFTGYVKVQPAVRDTAVRKLNEEFFGPAPARGGGGGRGNQRASLAPEKLAEYDRRMAEIETRWPSANVQDFVNHIDHAVKVAGIDHVGISSDFDGGGGVKGWNGADETFNVTLELVRRGYSEDDIRKLWGGNVLRVMGENQKRAKTRA
ncbi:MAG: Membrane dipeptidase [Gemmatimonadetes bacterium]|nr:Membrane dipeptidase [Gemmatimonadota bacterium]